MCPPGRLVVALLCAVSAEWLGGQLEWAADRIGGTQMLILFRSMLVEEAYRKMGGGHMRLEKHLCFHPPPESGFALHLLPIMFLLSPTLRSQADTCTVLAANHSICPNQSDLGSRTSSPSSGLLWQNANLLHSQFYPFLALWGQGPCPIHQYIPKVQFNAHTKTLWND